MNHMKVSDLHIVSVTWRTLDRLWRMEDLNRFKLKSDYGILLYYFNFAH